MHAQYLKTRLDVLESELMKEREYRRKVSCKDCKEARSQALQLLA